MTCGPWRPTSLELYTSRLSDLYFTSSVDKSLKSAQVVAKAEVEGEAADVKLVVSIDGKEIDSKTIKASSGLATHTFDFQDPQLWYPAPYGKQPLYTLTATLLDSETEIDPPSDIVPFGQPIVQYHHSSIPNDDLGVAQQSGNLSSTHCRK